MVGGETRGEPAGLALSSRNRYLDADARAQELGVEAVLATARAGLRHAHGLDLDYLVVTDPDLGELPPDVRPGTPARLLAAVRVRGTRLIDNLPLTLGPPAR